MSLSIFRNMKYFRVYACYLKVNKHVDYFNDRDLVEGSMSNKCAFKKRLTVICPAIIFVFFSTLFAIGSLTQVTAFAQSNDNLTETTQNGASQTAQEIVASDIVNSSVHNDSDKTVYYVTVLPPGTGDSIYSGLITFSATEPVKIEVPHATSLPTNATNSYKLDHMGIHFNEKSIPTSLIYPNYNGKSFSYSIPFTGKALEFSYDKPFVLAYTVNAQVVQKSGDSTQKVISQEVPGAYFKASAGTMLVEVIPYLTVDTLQQLPFSDLSPSELSMIIDKVPIDNAKVILKKIPSDKQQEILNGLTAEKRQELGMVTTQ